MEHNPNEEGSDGDERPGGLGLGGKLSGLGGLSAADSIKPGFLKGLGGKKDNDSEKGSSEKARDSLKGAEEGAGKSPLNKIGEGIKGARSSEKAGGGFFSGKGRELISKDGRGIKNSFKKGGPIAGIFAILIALGMGMADGALSLMPVAIEEMIIEKFNSIGISSTVSSDNLLNTQLNQGTLKKSEKRGELTGGVAVNLFAFSEHQVEQLASQGIKTIDNVSYGGAKITVLLYKTEGKYKAVVGSDYLGKVSNAEIIKAAGIGENDFGGQISVANAFADPNFKNPYTTASKSWRGGASGWFDNIMSGVTEVKLGVGRNRWVRYATKMMNGLSDDFKKVAKSATLEKTTDGGVVASEEYKTGEHTEIRNGKEETVPDLDQQNIETVKVETKEGGIEELDADSGALSKSSTTDQIEKSLTSKAVKAAAAMADAADYVCAVLDGVMAIYTAVSAYQNLQFLNLISGFLEAVDKVKAGEGDSSPINEYGTNLTTTAPTYGNDGKVVEGREKKTAIESAGIAWLFGKNSYIKQDDPSVQNVNFESIMSNLSSLTKDISFTSDVYNKCGYVRAGAAAVNLVSTIISFIPIVGQGFKAIQLSVKAVAKTAIKIAAMTALYLIIPVATKKVTKLLIKDAATEWLGEDLGNAVVEGAGKYLGGNGTSGGQSPGSTEKVLAYLNVQNTVIADEAKYQRSVRSPFDITSHYTFLGSLTYSLLPMAYSSGGLMSVLNNVSSTVSSSVVAMLPTANAIDNQSVLTSNGNCTLLGTVDAQGDAFCNPYIITDTSTINMAAEDIVQIVMNMNTGGNEIASLTSQVKSLGNNFDSDGKIKEGSPLAKYTLFCGQRTSQYGIQDAQIASAVSGSDTTAVKILSKVPIISDVTTIVTGLAEEANLGWSTGSSCVASDKNPHWENEYKYYQRYDEIQRLVENIDPGYKSTVGAFLDDYYEKNPLDTSFEGTLARFSGMTKEKVEDTLALMEYYEFLNEYNPSERYAFGAPVLENKKTLRFDNENELANTYIVLLNEISFADVRNRSFAV
ncbi:hypothetical protein IJH24_03230 [Candidatus Saccharibacteria bacterium]|nr:hypothetical protein [Candidatus Saccharibacteria bacterium]